MEKGRSSLPDSIKQAAYHGKAACFSVLTFQKIFKLSVEFFRIFQKQSVAAAREDYKPAFSAQMFFHIFPVGRSVEAVSYTHLDVYKRQFTLRPQSLAEYIGQKKATDNLKIFIEAARCV